MIQKPKLMHESWMPLIGHLFSEDNLNRIKAELIKKPFNPSPAERVFAAFEMPVDKVNVVIIGQSPYPQPQFANGIAFAIPDKHTQVQDWPQSLITIAENICETRDRIEIGARFDPSLQDWIDCGVLLLNTALTIPQFSRSSEHRGIWFYFMVGVLEALASLNRTLIFYFIGSHAADLAKSATGLYKHKQFFSIHPAAVAYDPSKKFDGKFQDIDKTIEDLSLPRVYWALPF